jgi:hypothetical protein
MRFTVDPWDPTYGTSVDAEIGASTAEIDTDVETPAAGWVPVPPSPGLLPPAAVLFVDGVRRVDAQVWVDEGDGSVSPGLCASYAAGVVCCCADGGAHLTEVAVRRSLVTTASAAEQVVTGAGTYAVVAAGTSRSAGAPVQILSAALQADLGKTEAEVAVLARRGHAPCDSPAQAGEDDLLVVDGRLRGRPPLPRAIGFVKTHSTSYLRAPLGAIVGQLAAGQRTPVFRIGDPTHPTYSWYLRLPGASTAPWAGVVRVECGGELTPGAAVALADLSQATLVRYASSEYKDSRAPQNLYPIAGLERGLRRRLGEPALLYRALRAVAA